MWWGDKTNTLKAHIWISAIPEIFTGFLSSSSERRTPTPPPPGHRYHWDTCRYAGEFTYPTRWSRDSMPLLSNGWKIILGPIVVRGEAIQMKAMRYEGMGQKGISWDAVQASSAFVLTLTVKCPAHRAIRLVYRIFFMEYLKTKKKRRKKLIPGKQKPLWQWLSI